jgi:hypothetical protein
MEQKSKVLTDILFYANTLSKASDILGKKLNYTCYFITLRV